MRLVWYPRGTRGGVCVTGCAACIRRARFGAGLLCEAARPTRPAGQAAARAGVVELTSEGSGWLPAAGGGEGRGWTSVRRSWRWPRRSALTKASSSRRRLRRPRSPTRSTPGCTTSSSSRASSPDPARLPLPSSRRSTRRHASGAERHRRESCARSPTARSRRSRRAEVGRYPSRLDADPWIPPPDGEQAPPGPALRSSSTRHGRTRSSCRANPARSSRQAPRTRLRSRSTSTSQRRYSPWSAPPAPGLHRDPSRPAVSGRGARGARPLR